MRTASWLVGLVAAAFCGVPRAWAGEECPAFANIDELERPRWVKHRLVPREHIEQIAHRYRVTPEELREWNDLTTEENPSPGTILRIHTRRPMPPRERLDYTVQEGDTWWRVAAKHGVDSKDLRAYNWPYEDKMVPGQTIRVWADPLLLAWIRQSEPSLPLPESGRLRRGGVGIGPPQAGRLLNGVQIPESPGYELRFPDMAYGTTFAVEALLAAIRRFQATSSYAGVLRIGAMSTARGGPLGSHRSHQTGRDVDIRLPRRVGVPRGIPLTPKRIDWLATWHLILAFETAEVAVIFLDTATQRRVSRAAKAAGVAPETIGRILQYPRGSHIASALVQHAPGHDTHMHVRFRCGPCEPECVENRVLDP